MRQTPLVDAAVGLGPSLARALVRWRAWVLLAWALAAAALLPAAAGVRDRLQVGARVTGSQSDAVARLLGARFDSPFARSAVVVLTGAPDPRTAAGAAALRELVDAVAAVPGVTRTLSHLDIADPAFVGANGETFVVVGLDAAPGAADSLVPRLRAGTADLAAALGARHPGTRVLWTGEDALNHDLRLASAADVARAERRALPLTLLILLLAFGAAAAAAIPVAVGALAIALALGAASLLAGAWPLSVVLQNVVTMLGLGLGIDYTLLLVSRFREARADGRGPEAAAVEAARTAGHTVLVSATAVAVGFAALLAVPLAELRSIAVGGLLVVLTSALLAVTLVPGLLAWLGARVDLGRLPRRAPLAPARGDADGRRTTAWHAWGRWVARRPLRTLLLAGAPLVLLAWQARRLEPRLPRGDWLPAGIESAQGARALRAMGRGGVVQTIRVLLVLPPGHSALDGDGWEATRRLGAALAADPRVARVRSLPTVTGGAPPGSLLALLVPDAVRRTFTSRDQRLALLEVLPADSLDGAALPALVRRLRALDGDAADVPGARLLVGGVPALNADYADAVAGRTPLVVALVVGGTLVALLVGFRSLLVPLKAVALNLLTVGAALGVVVLVFHDGHGARLIGLEAPLDGTFAAVPLLVFCVVFGLSMDYEVFLLARVVEARRGGATDAGALAAGVARSGRVITSAAAVMVVVFGAFALGDFVLVQILGVALAAAVVLDATLVRLAVGPALLALAGRWNWWPGDAAPRRAARAAASAAADRAALPAPAAPAARPSATAG